MRVGLLSDMHGDYENFRAALTLFEGLGVTRILCMGDATDRGPDADKIIAVLREREIPCVAGNHDRTVVTNQAHWRQRDNAAALRQYGRIVTDDSIAYLKQLPETLRLTIENKRILTAHGAPWSDVVSIFRDSRQTMYERLHREHSPDTDIILLGHTHEPMHVTYKALHIINPGSTYGVTLRDSHTCAVLTLPQVAVQLYDVKYLKPVPLDVVER